MKLTKEKHGKRFAAAAVSGLLAAAVLITAVLSRKIEAEAAETFLGIEELRNEVAESGRTYTILEIVPNRNAAEIGFLTDGYEPVLSTWNDEKKQWESWKEKLCSLITFDERKAFIEGLKVELQTYYDAKGIIGEKPVTGAKDAYEESDTKADGFTAITAAAVEKTGWFEKAAEAGGETYQLKFKYMGLKENYEEESDWVYYKISGEPKALSALNEEELKNLPADTVIYKKETGEGVFSIKGLWGELNGEEPETEETTKETETESVTEPANEQETENETTEESQTESTGETQSETETTVETETATTEEPESETEQESSTPESSVPESSEQESSVPESSEPESSVTESSEQESSEPERADSTDTKKESEGVQTAEEQTASEAQPVEENESGPESSEEQTEAGTGETKQAEEQTESETATESQTEEQNVTEEEQTTAESLEKTNTLEAQNVDAQAEEAEEYYLVSFEKIEDVSALADTDTIYIVEEGGIILSSHGEYSFVESADEKLRKQTYTFGGITIYCKNTFTNNEWFKKNALDMEADQYKKFKLEVLTFTPAELNEMSELPKFDFLYLNSGARVINSEAEKISYGKDTMDLSEAVVKELFVKITANGIPCLVDGAIMYEKDAETGTISTIEAMKETQIFKFAALLCQKSLDDWSQYSTNAGITDSDKNFSTEQTYCRFGTDSIINSNFAKATIHKDEGEVEEGFQGVLDEINLENLYRESDTGGNYEKLSTDISEARVLRHIINYRNRRTTETKKNVKVLEIQPALTTTAEITLEQLQQWAPGVESIETTIMTTAEFIGKIEKLNETYDLIYIGTSKEHLNISHWVNDSSLIKKNPYLGSTVFNDSDMDGLIYYNIGDLRVVYVAMAGLLNSEYPNGNKDDWPYYYNYVRYGGNDITKEKMNALISFLDGSYPIIVSDDFMEQPATLFEKAKFTGRRGTLDVGVYNATALRERQIYAGNEGKTKTERISSLKVKEGYRVTLYSGANFSGEYIAFEKDVEDLSKVKMSDGKTSWNDKCNSIKIEKIEGAQPAKAVDGDHIDNCTYMYEFVNKAIQNRYTNFYAKGDIDENGSELLKFYLNRPKAELVNFTVNGTKGGTSGENAINDAYYIQPGANGKYNLRYSFTIRNEGAATADTRYYCKLYIDVNADGKFSEEEEVSDINMTHNGGAVSANELYAGKEYVLTREVPQGYKGLLPWKVEVCQVNNANIYTSMNGYTKLEGLEKEVLKICQINKSDNGVLKLKDEIANESSPFHILIYGGDYNGVHYEGISDDFEIDVTSLTISEFQSKYYKNHDYLKDFNMLILGFSDMYGEFDGNEKTGPMSAIVEFINSGKSVLLSHDTTSFFNNPQRTWGQQKGYPWRNNLTDVRNMQTGTRNAATLNTYIRPLVGMDRYGVLEVSALQKGVALKEGDSRWSAVINSGKDVAYKPKSGRKETVPQVHGYSYALISAKDFKVDASSKLQSYTRYELYSPPYDDSVMPDSWRFTNKYRNIRYDKVYYTGNQYETESSYGEVINPDNGEVNNVHATQVNKGQITEYPYKLKEDFEIAQTHAQYYELDYTADDDHDGQSDLVVWYCLGGRTSSNGNEQTIYSQSPNDVRNNYYIYNKGNITYTGMGHSAAKTPNYTFEEAKLFINTMIASYQAGIKPPYISVKESGLKESAEIHTMYRFYDDANGLSLNDDATTGDSEKLYFTVQDINFVKGTRNIMSHVYYKDTSGNETITVDGTDIAVTKLDDRIYNAASGEQADANNLQSGGIYYILVPKSVMAKCETGLNLYFEAQSIITTNSKVYTTDKTYAELEVLKAYLFDLD